MVEGASSKRGLANSASSCHCCGHGYGNQSQHRGLNGRPGADTYNNRCSLSDSLSRSQPYSHRHAYAYAYAYAYAHAYAHAYAQAYANADANADANANANTDPDAHAHPFARLQHSIPKLGVAILS